MDGRDDSTLLPARWAEVPLAVEHGVVQRHDGTERPVEFDRALWVEMDGDRGFIEGNGHTHPGRFLVCFPDQGYATLVSVRELTVISAAARYWLQGFLSGSELKFFEYMGREPSEDFDSTDEEWARYKNFNKQFGANGWRPYPHMRPNRALVITDDERAEINLDPWHPWTYVAERVLVPDHADGAIWVEVDPQPEMNGPWLEGSICAERGYSNLMWLESGWSVCCDCGEVEMSSADDH